MSEDATKVSEENITSVQDLVESYGVGVLPEVGPSCSQSKTTSVVPNEIILLDDEDTPMDVEAQFDLIAGDPSEVSHPSNSGAPTTEFGNFLGNNSQNELSSQTATTSQPKRKRGSGYSSNLPPTKIILFIDIEAESAKESLKGSRSYHSKYVCGYCNFCKTVQCKECFACKQNALGEESPVWSLICHRVDSKNCRIICQEVMKCRAYKNIIHPYLSMKYLGSFNSTFKDNRLTKVLPLCYPIPHNSPIVDMVEVILAMQHIMEALQQDMTINKHYTCTTDAAFKPKPAKNFHSSGQSSNSSPMKKRNVSTSSSSNSDCDFECFETTANEKTRWSNRTSSTKSRSKSANSSGVGTMSKSGLSVVSNNEEDSGNDAAGEEDVEDDQKNRKVKNKKATSDDSDDDDSGDEFDGLADEAMLEASMQDLKSMQDAEITEAIRLGTLKLSSRLRSEMFSETFQLKVGRFIADGGNLKSLSERLDLTTDTLRAWRRLHENNITAKKVKKMEAKKAKKRAARASFLNKNKTQSKTSTTSNSKVCPSTVNDVLASVANKPVYMQVSTSYIAPVSTINRVTNSAVSHTRNILPRPPNRDLGKIHIYDKGASDVSEEESDFDDDVVLKPAIQFSLPFLCNDCREIFRDPGVLQNHLYKCPKRLLKFAGLAK